MGHKILDDFKIEQKVPPKLFVEYQGKLPKQILQIWEEYGFGSFLDGFLRVVNPADFRDILTRISFVGKKSIPIFVTVLGDMIVWQKNSYLTILRFRHGTFFIMGKGFTYFFDDLLDKEYLEKFLKPKNYYEVLQKQGSVAYDECFGYVPLLCLGGFEDVEHLKKCKILEHMELILSAIGSLR